MTRSSHGAKGASKLFVGQVASLQYLRGILVRNKKRKRGAPVPGRTPDVTTNMQILTELSTGSGAYERCNNLARKFLVEFKLSVWLKDTCEKVGMAPSSDDVYDKYSSLLKEAGLQVHHKEGSDSWKNGSADGEENGMRNVDCSQPKRRNPPKNSVKR